MIAVSTWAARAGIALIEATAGWRPAARARLGDALGTLAWWLAAPRRRITLRNLELCFPQWSAAQRSAVGRRCFRHLARALIDHGALARMDLPALRRFVRMEGVDHLLEPANRPLIMVVPHFAGLDAAAVFGGSLLRVISIYARSRNAALEDWLLAIRQRFNPHLLIRRERFDLRAVVRGLKEGLPLFYLPDQDPGARNAVFAPFFGIAAATLPTVSRLARLTDAKVVLVVAEMTADGYLIHVEPPWADFPSESVEADTARMNAEIERWVRRMPAQYLWTHRRFKTRPAGEASLY
jgi:KDO2-lipid IV(A) lauroyltransferase